MTPLEAIDSLARLLEEENAALRAGDVARAPAFAERKEAAAARLTELGPEIAALREGPCGAEIDARIAALGALIRRNGRLVADAGHAARDLVAALDAQDGRTGGYDAQGSRTRAARRGGMLNESI